MITTCTLRETQICHCVH